MNITPDQQQSLDRGEAVRIDIKGKAFFLLSEKRLEELDQMDRSMRIEEMDLLADEAHEIISQGETDEY